MMTRAWMALVVLGSLLLCVGCPEPINADLILLNGKIETLDA